MFVASSILPNAAVLSSFTLAIAFSFSAGVNAALLLIAVIWSVALLFTASIAGCLSNFTTLSTGIVSLEPSLYVTSNLSPFWTSVSTTFAATALSTAVPFLSSKFLSSFFLEYSKGIFSLIFSNSAAGILTVSVTTILLASSNSLISYFFVWDFNTIENEPGSVAYELLVALLTIILPSVSVAVA